MGKLFLQYIDGNRIYVCVNCRTHLTCARNLLSKIRTFKEPFCRINVILGPSEQKAMISGVYVSSDVFCKGCQLILGWKYEKAYDESQKYKEGKFVLERAHFLKDYWTE